jgi:hypothetical protein
MLVILAPRRLRQEEASLGYIVRPCLKNRAVQGTELSNVGPGRRKF